MKILHTIPGFGIRSGGTTTSTYDLLRALINKGVEVEIMSPSVKKNNDKIIGENEEWIKIIENDLIFRIGYSPNAKKFLKINDYDLYHTNGLWLYINHLTCSFAKKINKPYIITLHGMLYPQALKRSKLKKEIMKKFFFDSDITNANCIHATCVEEVKYCKELGIKTPIALIPNAVPLIGNADNLISKNKDKNKFKIGFLGRLHPRKNIHNLIQAWKDANIEDLGELVIIGKGESDYEEFLKEEVQRLDLKNVIFEGFISGKKKYEILASLTALCVPSDFENFGMIITESLSVGTPVIASKGTPWGDLEEYKCGWWIDNDIKSLSECIRKVNNLDKAILHQMGLNGYNLVLNKYSDERVAEKMKQLYEWILNKTEKPEFIY